MLPNLVKSSQTAGLQGQSEARQGGSTLNAIPSSRRTPQPGSTGSSVQHVSRRVTERGVAKCECTETGPCSQNCAPSSMAHILRPIPCPGLNGPILHLHISPSTLQRVAAVSHHLCSLGQNQPSSAWGEGWPAPTPERLVGLGHAAHSLPFSTSLTKAQEHSQGFPQPWPEDWRAGVGRLCL